MEIKKTPSCFDILLSSYDLSNRSIIDLITIKSYSFFVNTLAGVIPLFAFTIYNAMSPQPVVFDHCYTVDANANWNNVSSYIRSCPATTPMRMLINNFPRRPGISPEAPSTTNCTGLASGVELKFDNIALSLQIFVYFILLFYSAFLVNAEARESSYCLVAYYLGGVYVPTRDNVQNFKWEIPFFLSLSAVYLYTLFGTPLTSLNWYVFPTQADESAFLNANGDSTNLNWCSSLSYPVYVTYKQSDSRAIEPSDILEFVVFFSNLFALSRAQKVVYDWVDTDAYMNSANKDSLVYYDIHKNRDRIFNETMLEDWRVLNVYLPVLEGLLASSLTVNGKTLLNTESNPDFKKKLLLEECKSVVNIIKRKSIDIPSDSLNITTAGSVA